MATIEPILNFLSFTAQIPLCEGEDLRSSEAKGFTKTKLNKELQPPFDGSKYLSYALKVPKGTTHVGVMATSFSGCTLKINDVIGNMSVVELTKVAKNTVKVSLHESNDGESKATYKIQVDVSEDGEVVMKEKGVPEDKKSPRALALARWGAVYEGPLERRGRTWARAQRTCTLAR